LIDEELIDLLPRSLKFIAHNGMEVWAVHLEEIGPTEC
jgi:hypothetical protein